MSQEDLPDVVLMQAVQDLVAWAKQPKEGGVALLWAAPNRAGDREGPQVPDWGCIHTASFAITYILHCAVDAPPNKSLSPLFLGRLLQVAARSGLRGMVQALASRGADLNVKGTWRIATGAAVTLQALQVAAASGHEDVVLSLLSREAIKVDATVKGGRTVLHVAASCGQDRVVRRLLLNEQVVKDALDNERRSALHVAAMGGHEKVVKCLINEGGLNKNAKDQDGCTALHLAVAHGDVKLVKWLLGEGRLDAEATDNEGRTPFLLAVEKNRESVVRWLLEKVGVNRHATLPEGKETALHRAAFYGHGRLLRYLVEDAKLPLDTVDAWGHTSLHLAAYRGHGAIVRYVCEVWPVGRDQPDKDGKTPLHLAAYRGHDAILRYLLGLCGVDKLVSLKDCSQMSVLEAVPRPQHPRLAAFLEHALYCSGAVYRLSDVTIDEAASACLHGPSRGAAPPSSTGGLLLCSFTDSNGLDGRDPSTPVSHKACVELLTLPRAEEERTSLLCGFERERLGHANLCHARIMQYLGHVQGEHVVGVLLERVDGSLLGYLRGLNSQRPTPLPPSEQTQHALARALSLASDVAEALEVLHLHGLVQGNLHVGSVMVKGNHALLSKPKAALLSLGSKQQRLGSQTWMDTDLPPPELSSLSSTLQTRPPSSLDMWGLGLVLCRLGLWGVSGVGDEDWCTAARAGGAQELQAFTQRARDAWEAAGYGGVASVIGQCMSRDPKDRPTAREARGALLKAAEHRHASSQADKRAKAHGQHGADQIAVGGDQAVAAR